MKHFFRLLTTSLLFLGLSTGAMAQVTKPVTVFINGMVCAFCAQGLVKSFKDHAGIQRVQTSLENKSLTLHIDERTPLNDQEITRIVKDAGYDVERIDRAVEK